MTGGWGVAMLMLWLMPFRVTAAFHHAVDDRLVGHWDIINQGQNNLEPELFVRHVAVGSGG